MTDTKFRQLEIHYANCNKPNKAEECSFCYDYEDILSILNALDLKELDNEIEESKDFICIKCGYNVDVSNDFDLEKDGLFVCHRCIAEYVKEVLIALD